MLKKILAIILLFQSLAFAQTNQNGATSVDNWYEISDFSGGLKSHVSQYLTPKNSAYDAHDVRFNNKYGAVSKRNKMLQLSACRAFPVKSLFRYYKADATKYTIETSSTFMDYVADSTGSCTNLATGLSDSKRWSWVTYKNIAIGTNGTDRAKKWDGALLVTANTDGHRTAGDLIADLGAPFAELNTGSNLDASSWYQYKVAFYDGSTYKYSNAKSNPINTGSSVRDVSLTDIPLGPSGTTTRYIFRTDGQSSRANVIALGNGDYKLVASIANNTARTYNDAVADGSLTTVYSTWISSNSASEVSPPYSKYALIHKDRLFLANDPSGTESGKSTIYWSAPFNPDYFYTATDYELFRPDDGDQITVIKNLSGILTIGKEGSWNKFYTDASSSTGWTTSAPFSFVGCTAPYSAANSPLGIIYLGRYGLYSFNGQVSELISDVVTDKILDILKTNQSEVAGVYQDNQYLMTYTSTETGSAINDRVLILDLIRNSYTQDFKNIDSWMVLDSGTDFGTLYSGSSDTDGKVYAHSGAFDDLVYRYKSQFDEGTFDATKSGGTQEEPTLSLGWDKTWTTVSGSWNAQGSSTWLVRTSPGTWISPAIQINANALDKLYWNEQLGSYGDITFAIKLASTEAGLGAASYSSEFTNPSGSDISGLTANTWCQIRATFSSSNFTETPSLILEDSFVFHMTYSKTGSSGETTILSSWENGFSDLNGTENPKRIKEIQVFYEGTSGTLAVSMENDQGVSQSFDIDMSVNPSTSTSDLYYGNTTEKIYTWFPSVTNSPIGRKWKFSFSENGVIGFRVNRLVVRYDQNNYVPIK